MNSYIVLLLCVSSVPILAERYIQLNEEPSNVFVVRNKPAELPCNITAENNVVISWSKDNVPLDLTSDTRRTILPHGSLRFKTIVRKKKSTDDGVYKCMGETNVNGRTFKIVSRSARLTVVAMAGSFVKKPQDLIVSEGETALFKCEVKRSHPAATITWSKEGKNTDLALNFRFVVFPSGILEILSVMPSDAGHYICKASNEMMGKEVTEKAKLTITPASTANKPSKFLVKPTDVTTLNKENAILECIITGYPKPQVDWYKDGKKITLSQSGHYTKYGASSLQVSAVKPDDSGKYECVIGTERAGAFLQVLVPPKFVALPQDVKTVEDKDITFQCEVTGHPTPKITWYRNGGNIDDIEHISIKKNAITIMEVLDSDEGIYQCFASNDGGEIKASAQLVVYGVQTTPTTTIETTRTPAVSTARPTSIRILPPSEPKNVKAQALNETAIAVSWQPPDQTHGIIKKYTLFTYKFTGGGLAFQSMLTTQQTLLVVTRLKPDTLYRFAVYASNERKKGAVSSVQEQTKSMVVDKLGPPEDVKVKAIDSKALQVSWKPPSQIMQQIRNYSIEYRDVDRINSPWQFQSSLRHVVVLLKLHPYTKYAIKVTAHTDSGPGQTSAVVFARTKSGKPKGPPQNIIILVTSNVSNVILVAKWSPPLKPNGNITGYVIELKNENTGVISNFTTKKKNKVFLNVKKSTTYAFRVAAVTEGRGEFSQWVRKVMPSKAKTENVVPGQPTNLRARVLLGMVRVSWDAPNESHIIIREYVVSYGKMTPDDAYIHLPKNVTSYLLKNLASKTMYIIRVRAANKMGQGLEVLETVNIPSLKQSSRIYNVQAVPFKKRSMKLSWIDPTILLQPNVGYHVKFEKDNIWVEFNVTQQTFLIVKNLRAGMAYTFYIKKNNEPNYNIVSNSTKEEAPSAPKDVTVSFASEESTVKVHWDIPDEPNGKLTNYRICWKPETINYKNRTCKMVKGHVLNSKISNINASLNYSVKILAKNRAGEGEFSKPEGFNGGSVILLAHTSEKGPTLSSLSNNKTIDGQNRTVNSTNNDVFKHTKFTPTKVDKTKIGESSGQSLTMDEKTLWIVIAIIAAITLIAIVIISIILCRKRARNTPVLKRKQRGDPYKAVANGNSKKKTTNKDNYWIKNNIKFEPCVKKNNDSVATIPRCVDEVKPLDSPLQSRKDPPLGNEKGEDHSYKRSEDYQPIPTILPNIKIHQSPFMPADPHDFPPLPECLDNNEDEGPATSSDYGSEEIVAPKYEMDGPPITYMPKNTPNGCVSVAADYDFPSEEPMPSYDMDTSTLHNLMKDLDAIMAKEDRV